MSAIGQRDDHTKGNEGVGRFLRGTITERFLPRRKEDEAPGPAVAVFAAPITVTLTDAVRQITDTVPITERGIDVGAAIVLYTTTIPAITATITDSVTVIP